MGNDGLLDNDRELVVAGSISGALALALCTQVIVYVWWSLALPFWVFVAVASVIEGYGLRASWRLLRPHCRLFFNGQRLLICDQRGRKRAVIHKPKGFAAPFFIGLQAGNGAILGLFAQQLSREDLASLLRWMRNH